MKLMSLLLTAVTVLLIVSDIHAKSRSSKGRVESLCKTCRDIAKSFMKGLERTKKSNYGGGNTDWEETRLGEYANSEIRLTEIVEHLCDNNECHYMVEEHEKYIDTFWFERKEEERTEEDFLKYFCIESIKVCCPDNTYGPNCTACLGGTERPCKDNGQCVGGGTRGGNGKCKCNTGFSGKFCDKCVTGYYEGEKNESHTTCKVCDISCKTSCKGEGPTKCDDCKTGYNYSPENGCEDINECDSNPCHINSYCINTKGSYSCMSCNVACDGCTGTGPHNCIKCNTGYRLHEGKCVDMDECTEEGYEDRCTQEGQKCENTVGTFRCVCQPGYVKDGSSCRPEVRDGRKEEEEGEERRQRESDPHRDNTISILVALACFGVFFFVLGNLCWVIHPLLISIPVALSAIVLYYAVMEYEGYY